MTPPKIKKELTKEEKEIIAQTKILERRDQIPQKAGIILTGGIDSSVTLCQLKKATSDIQPIIFEETDQSTVQRILDHEGITNTIKVFEKGTTKQEKKDILQWCFENNISPLYFGANIEEDGINSIADDMLEWRQISSELNNSAVDIVTPLHPVNKYINIQNAKHFGILELTAKPSDSPKYRKIREEAFKEAKIEDPYAEPEKTNE